MIEVITGIIGIFNGFKNGLSESWKILKKGKKKKVIQKLVILKITLEDIIELAENILSDIEEILKQKKTSKKQLDEFRTKIKNQSRNLSNLLSNLEDETSQKILKTFEPNLRRQLEIYIYDKEFRMNFFMHGLYDLDVSDIRKKYNNDYLFEGLNLVQELKTISKSFTDFISKHASIEDIL
jgi:hypothetical protein